MILLSKYKLSCDKCTVGHRTSACDHLLRPLKQILPKGRPISQCDTCRSKRKQSGKGTSHHRCICKAAAMGRKRQLELRFKQGTNITLTVAGENELISLLQMASHPPLPDLTQRHNLLEGDCLGSMSLTISKKGQTQDISLALHQIQISDAVDDVDWESVLLNPCRCQFGEDCVCGQTLKEMRMSENKTSSRRVSNSGCGCGCSGSNGCCHTTTPQSSGSCCGGVTTTSCCSSGQQSTTTQAKNTSCCRRNEARSSTLQLGSSLPSVHIPDTSFMHVPMLIPPFLQAAESSPLSTYPPQPRLSDLVIAATNIDPEVAPNVNKHECECGCHESNAHCTGCTSLDICDQRVIQIADEITRQFQDELV